MTEPPSFFATGVVDTGGKFAVGVVDTGGKFATGVVDTGGAPWLANISVNFWKKFEMTLLLFEGFGGRRFMKKSEAKNLLTSF